MNSPSNKDPSAEGIQMSVVDEPAIEFIKLESNQDVKNVDAIVAIDDDDKIQNVAANKGQSHTRTNSLARFQDSFPNILCECIKFLIMVLLGLFVGFLAVKYRDGQRASVAAAHLHSGFNHTTTLNNTLAPSFPLFSSNTTSNGTY